MPALALFQPDIPQNTGTLLRLGACLDVPIHIIEPAGFDVSDRNLRRAAMDYIDHVTVTKHVSWTAFVAYVEEAQLRLVLGTTKASTPFIDFAFRADDIILLGRESAGVPDYVHERADERITIPMRNGQRSLNLAVSGAMLISEALRQSGGWQSPLNPL